MIVVSNKIVMWPLLQVLDGHSEGKVRHWRWQPGWHSGYVGGLKSKSLHRETNGLVFLNQYISADCNICLWRNITSSWMPLITIVVVVLLDLLAIYFRMYPFDIHGWYLQQLVFKLSASKVGPMCNRAASLAVDAIWRLVWWTAVWKLGFHQCWDLWSVSSSLGWQLCPTLCGESQHESWLIASWIIG